MVTPKKEIKEEGWVTLLLERKNLSIEEGKGREREIDREIERERERERDRESFRGYTMCENL